MFKNMETLFKNSFVNEPNATDCQYNYQSWKPPPHLKIFTIDLNQIINEDIKRMI